MEARAGAAAPAPAAAALARSRQAPGAGGRPGLHFVYMYIAFCFNARGSGAYADPHSTCANDCAMALLVLQFPRWTLLNFHS